MTVGYLVLFFIIVATNTSHAKIAEEDTLNSHLVIRTNAFPKKSNSSMYTEWTPWSRCENCWTRRMRICTHPSCKDSRVHEERPCDRKRCQRKVRLKSIDKRLHIIKEVKEDKLKSLFKPNKKRIWSNWSDWSECSNECVAMRYKRCKNFNVCKSRKKLETAHCFLEQSNCEIYVLQLMQNMNMKFEDAAQYSYNTPRQENTNKRKPHRRRRRCGRPLRKLGMLKIIGGRDSQRNKWPWHVAILNKYNEVFCSGTLIAPRWVLTAGHCLRHYLKVRLNEYDISMYDGETSIRVAENYIHPHYNPTTIDNDIALLRLPKAVKNEVACLPQRHPKIEQKCSVMGWGKLRNRDEYGSNILQEAEVPIVNNSTCRRAYKTYQITDNMFCAGYKTGKADTCAGDSGGGLMCRSLQHARKNYYGYTVQGITSFGDECGQMDKYGIYTNVINYVDWINKIIADYKNPSPRYQPLPKLN